MIKQPSVGRLPSYGYEVKKDQAEANAEKPYAEFLKEQLEASKADFTEDEIKTITKFKKLYHRIDDDAHKNEAD